MACNPSSKTQSKALVTPNTRIVSLNGTLTEDLCALGFGANIVGTDITSTYPDSMMRLPKVGHTSQMTSESILSLNPNIVFALREETKPELAQQLEAAGIKLFLFDLDYSAKGATSLIKQMADTLGVPDKAPAIVNAIEQPLKEIQPIPTAPKVLFIYARGTGTLLVAGEETRADGMIRLAGGQNAATGFKNFKPLTPEALVTANPDAILLFNSGLESLQGETGLLNVPGMTATKAGKDKAVIAMDGQYLTGFGPRLGNAAKELNQKLSALATHHE